NLKTAEARVKAPAKDDDPKALEEARKARQAELNKLKAEADKKDYGALKKQWQEEQAYILDGYRMLANDNLCLACHQLGSRQPKERQGPPLQLAWERLRPEWTEQWIANPQRFFPTPMPQNFPANERQWQEFFVGSPRSSQEGSLDQIRAV